MSSARPPILILIDMVPAGLQLVRDEGFEIHVASAPDAYAVLPAAVRARVRAVVTAGSKGITAAQIAELPALEIICAIGAGFENIDTAAAQTRGIVVTNGRGTNDVAVADHTMALLLAIARGIPQADAAIRRGGWLQARHMRPLITGKKLGILGLGNIGEKIARRAEGGFDMEVGYHNRSQRDDVAWRYFGTPVSLAEWSDFLVVAAPGGASSRHLVNSQVLTALGSEGYLINIGRGTVVDTAALVSALKDRRIAGAALDVLEGEPQVPPELIPLDNLVLTPHIAGRAPEAVLATARLVIANLNAHFAGESVLTPVVPVRQAA